MSHGRDGGGVGAYAAGIAGRESNGGVKRRCSSRGMQRVHLSALRAWQVHGVRAVLRNELFNATTAGR